MLRRNLLWLLLLTLALSLTQTAKAQILGPLTPVSGVSPFLNSNADNPAGQSGTNYPSSEVEPWIAVNPTNRNNIIGVWQQDRWSNGGCRGLLAGVTFDGGLTWTQVTISSLSLVSGGFYPRVSDPWVTFAPDGSAYVSAISIDSTVRGVGVLVSKSNDGGLTWGTPTEVIRDPSTQFFDDKEAITADPTDPNYVYVVWDRLNGSGQPTIFARTTNGGLSWEPARQIGGSSATIGNQIVVAPNGTLYNFFINLNGNGSVALHYSTDKGETWHPQNPIAVSTLQAINVRDPDTNQTVRAGAGLFDCAVDPNNGALYAVWHDARFSSNAYDSIAFSASTDGGLTWSAPIRINKTPDTGPNANRQAFTPSVQVAADSTITVTYYDFRNNTTATGALTDHWAVRCTPSLLTPPTDPNSWGHEQRLTTASFDIKRAPYANGWFLGDYQGLDAAGNDFLTFFVQSQSADRASVFFRRIFKQAPVRVSGIISLEDCVSPAETLTFVFTPDDGTAPFTEKVPLGTNGTFEVENVTPGTYQVAVKGRKWLQVVRPIDASAGDVTGFTATLKGGDANDDNHVDVLDLNILIQAFDSASGSPNWDEATDFNCDGAVDVLDLDILLRNFDQSGDA